MKETHSETCTYEGCNLPYLAIGLCKKHYELNRRWGTPEIRGQRKINGDTCIVSGCDNKSVHKKMCWSHYERNEKYGNPLGGGRFRVKQLGNCIVKGCKRKSDSRGFCSTHYTTFTKYPIDPSGPFICYICGKEHNAWSKWQLSVDHVIPKSRGGANTKENLKIACYGCNSRKRDLTYDELVKWCESILSYSSLTSMKTFE